MHRERGFSLIEVLLVMALIAMATGWAAAVLVGSTPGRQLHDQARQVASQLRVARMRAAASGHPQQVTINPGKKTWRGPDGRTGRFSDGMAVTFMGAREVQPNGSEGSIVFFPDGLSTGGTVRIALPDAARDVHVSWLTGEVTIEFAESRQ